MTTSGLRSQRQGKTTIDPLPPSRYEHIEKMGNSNNVMLRNFHLDICNKITITYVVNVSLGFVSFSLFDLEKIGTRAQKQRRGKGEERDIITFSSPLSPPPPPVLCSRPNLHAVKKQKRAKHLVLY